MTNQVDQTNSAMMLTARPGTGGAAIAVLRLRGPGVARFLRLRFSRPVAAGKCVHGRLCDEAGNVIDDPLTFLSADGTWADISLHGGAWVIASALNLARQEHFAVTEHPPLPLPEVAMDDVPSAFEREVIGHLPLARTELAIRALLDQSVAWRQAIAGGLDIEAMLEDRSLWWLLHPPQIAIVGETNVGKSTLANQLFGRERSITADVPGTTRDWVGEMADIDGLAAVLVDTPGWREAADPIERAAIEASCRKIRGSDLVIVVVDATRPPSTEIGGGGALVVVNKIDRPGGWDFPGPPALAISALSGAGLDELRREIRKRFGVGDAAPRARCWTERQREILRRAQNDVGVLRELRMDLE